MVSKLDSKLEEFKNLYSSNNNFKQCLKTICLSMRKEMFSRLLSKIENDYPNEILSLLSLVPSNKSKYKYLVQYILDEMHLCPVCKKLTPKEQECCSRECQSKFIEVRERREQTCLKKYNVKNCFCSETLKQKSKETCLKKYNVEHPLQSESIKNKVKETCLKKYNVEHPLQSELIKNKVKETNFKKYSCWHSQTKEAKLKSKETCLKKYNAKSFTESNFFKNKNKLEFGVEFPSQKYELKNTDISKDDYILRYKNLNHDFMVKTFVKDNKLDFKNFIKYFCISESAGFVWKRKFNLNFPNITSNRSSQENDLFEWIKTEKICNDRKLVQPYEIDILLPKQKLGIEFNGAYWHSAFFKDKNYHLNKLKMAEEKGYQLFNIFDFDNIEIWKSMISNKLNLNRKIYARKCTIKELQYKDVKNFLNENHLQGSCATKINLGLFYENELVEVMTFKKPRFNSNYNYELIRLCSKKFTNVVGGASKLFKYFRKHFKGSVISYANRRFSNGKIYEVLGFKLLRTTEPNYFYCKKGKIYSRYQLQKHKLKNILEVFDSNKSETQNLEDNGFLKIYDCGNLVYAMD